MIQAQRRDHSNSIGESFFFCFTITYNIIVTSFTVKQITSVTRQLLVSNLTQAERSEHERNETGTSGHPSKHDHTCIDARVRHIVI